MQESVIYQDILQKGEERGKKQEALQLILHQLETFKPVFWHNPLSRNTFGEVRNRDKFQTKSLSFMPEVFENQL
ncbi:MAG: hypothetical protein V7K89_15800 [Nostoc sp.]|uniref:hypothetical protein n=1 Tax=Nostoc sp. TaxID=1180 RepID=UPI002FF4D6AD